MASTHDPYEALRYGEYRWFLAGVMARFMGFQMQSLVMGWQVYEITHDTFALGLIGLAEAVPFLALTLFGGCMTLLTVGITAWKVPELRRLRQIKG